MAAIEQERRISDQHSWIIDLDTTGIKPPRRKDWSIDYAGFTIKKTRIAFRKQGAFSELECYEVMTHRITSPVLCSSYLCASHQIAVFLKDRLARLTAIEVYKAVGEASSGPLTAEALIISQGAPEWEMFVKPSTWQYYDGEILLWIAQWKELQAAQILPLSRGI